MLRFFISVIFNIFVYSSSLDGMLCVYKGNDKKKFTNLNLKEIRHEADKKRKNWSSFQLNIKYTAVAFFFFVFLKLRLENACIL